MFLRISLLLVMKFSFKIQEALCRKLAILSEFLVLAKFNIICMTETWLHNEMYNAKLNFEPIHTVFKKDCEKNSKLRGSMRLANMLQNDIDIFNISYDRIKKVFFH